MYIKKYKIFDAKSSNVSKFIIDQAEDKTRLELADKRRIVNIFIKDSKNECIKFKEKEK